MIVGLSVANVALAVLSARNARRARRLVDDAIGEREDRAARERAWLRCVGMVAFIASEASGAPPSLREECRKILPPDVQIVITEDPGVVH